MLFEDGGDFYPFRIFCNILNLSFCNIWNIYGSYDNIYFFNTLVSNTILSNAVHRITSNVGITCGPAPLLVY